MEINLSTNILNALVTSADDQIAFIASEQIIFKHNLNIIAPTSNLNHNEIINDYRCILIDDCFFDQSKIDPSLQVEI